MGVKPREALRGPEERNALIAEHYALVTMFVAELWHEYAQVRRLGWDEAMQAGYLGLLRAGDLYDPATGHTFGTYLRAWVRQKVARLAVGPRQLHAVSLCEIGDSGHDDEWQPPSPCPTPYRYAAARDELRHALRSLDARTAECVRLKAAGETLEQIGRRFNVSFQSVQQWLKRAEARLGAAPLARRRKAVAR